MFELKKNFTLPNIQYQKNVKPFDFVYIEPGEFTMGAFNEKVYTYSYKSVPIEPINIVHSKGFWVSKYPVTQHHWLLFMSKETKAYKAYTYNPKKEIDHYGVFSENEIAKWIDNPNLPMYWSNWVEAMLYCRELNLRYKSIIPKGYHFSLPTVAQWEYACLAGLDHDYIELTNTGKKCVFYNIEEVGKNIANPWGLHDMLGCIGQMCFDEGFPYFDLSFMEEYPKDNDKYIDFVMSNILTESSIYLKNDADWRIIKGRGNSCTFRERERYTNIFHPSGHEPVLGFRVALRPISIADMNDYLLVEKGIKMV